MSPCSFLSWRVGRPFLSAPGDRLIEKHLPAVSFLPNVRLLVCPSLVGHGECSFRPAQRGVGCGHNSQSKNSTHRLFTPLLQVPFDLLERADALAVKMAPTADGIDRLR